MACGSNSVSGQVSVSYRILDGGASTARVESTVNAQVGYCVHNRVLVHAKPDATRLHTVNETTIPAAKGPRRQKLRLWAGSMAPGVTIASFLISAFLYDALEK